MRVCQRPGCGNLCVDRYCPTHLYADSRKIARLEYDSRRGSASARGYGRFHEKWRRQIIARDPLCTINVLCDKSFPAMSTDADHRIAISDGGDWSLENGQGSCHACHSYKTATHDSRFIPARSRTRDRSKRLGLVQSAKVGGAGISTNGAAADRRASPKHTAAK
jgi:5-methylcytosine-specific restriction protein A